MAHIIFGTRGIKHIVDQFIENLQWKYYPLFDADEKPVIAENGQPQLIQGALREFRLFEYVVPEQGVATAMNTIWPDLAVREDIKNPHDALSKKYKTIFWPFQKALGASKLPDFDKTKGAHPIATDIINVTARYPIGFRTDKKRTELGDAESAKTHGNEDL